MKRSTLSLVVFVVIGSLPSCLNLFKNPVARCWFYTHSSGQADNRDTLLTPASFLEIRPDGTYTRDFGRFEYGKWDFQGKQLSLRNQFDESSTQDLEFSGGNEMAIAAGQGIVANFESQPLPSQSADDPFSRENNRWRIRALSKETDREIRSRLRNHCQFWEAYFSWALKYELTTVDVRSTPTLIKIYGNGFTLKPFEALPAQWRSYFFDEEDCRKANQQIKDLFDNRTIAWAHTDNKFKMFIGVFQQMEQYLK